MNCTWQSSAVPSAACDVMKDATEEKTNKSANVFTKTYFLKKCKYDNIVTAQGEWYI